MTSADERRKGVQEFNEFNKEDRDARFEAIATLVNQLVQDCQSDPMTLLGLLRLLEKLHRDLRDELFQGSLPNNRHALYDFLRDIEANGGWPYIPRMRLKPFLEQLLPPEEEEDADEERSSS
jgi:hypothetical protein